MARSEVVWVPSLADGGARVALEAMAAGRPVVASRLPGLAEVVVEGETGFLVPPGDKIALARQTRRLLADAELRRRLGQAGRARIAQHFAARVAVERMAGLYLEPLAA
jgi:glycogen synthase